MEEKVDFFAYGSRERVGNGKQGLAVGCWNRKLRGHLKHGKSVNFYPCDIPNVIFYCHESNYSNKLEGLGMIFL